MEGRTDDLAVITVLGSHNISAPVIISCAGDADIPAHIHAHGFGGFI